MIIVVTTKNEVVNEFNTYRSFFAWLISSDFGVVDFGKALDNLKRDGGTVTVEPLSREYLEKLNIKEG